VESAIHPVVSKRFVKKQSMQRTLRGAHLLLQTRTKVLNGELEESISGAGIRTSERNRERGKRSETLLDPDFLARSESASAPQAAGRGPGFDAVTPC
jgi:hypothetical protein